MHSGAPDHCTALHRYRVTASASILSAMVSFTQPSASLRSNEEVAKFLGNNFSYLVVERHGRRPASLPAFVGMHTSASQGRCDELNQQISTLQP